MTSGDRAEIENVKNDRPSDWHANLCKQILFIKCHCTFYIYGPLGRKAFYRILKRCFISWITSLNIQKLQIFAIFASYLASIVKLIYKNVDFDFTVYYNQLLTGAMDEPIEGIACAVYSPEEGVWHRAQVKAYNFIYKCLHIQS